MVVKIRILTKFWVPDDSIRLLDRNKDGVGEIAVKGSNVMQGYYNRPDLDSEVFTEDGYLKTGDLGYLDSSGRLAICGRVKTMILGAGGENIYPEAIESIINNHEYVEESLVVSEGGRLIALVRLDLALLQKALDVPMEEIMAQAKKYLDRLKKEVNSRLAVFSRISDIRIQARPFERTPTLKIKRFLYE